MTFSSSSFSLFLFLVSTVIISSMVSELTSAIGHQRVSTNNKYPFLSLQNMPKTDFSCRDKILGGYYADAETQCQMFHICVKVAGVGVSFNLNSGLYRYSIYFRRIPQTEIFVLRVHSHEDQISISISHHQCRNVLNIFFSSCMCQMFATVAASPKVNQYITYDASPY